MTNGKSNNAQKEESPASPIIYDFDPRKIPNEYLRAVGLVTASASQTEAILRDLIGALLGIDNIQTAALATHMNFPLKDHIIRTLAELEAPSIGDVDEIDNLLDAVNVALDKRNTIVHNALVMHPDTGEVFSHRLKARGSLQVELKPVSVQEMEQDAAEIYNVGIDILTFMISKNIMPAARITPLRGVVDRKKKAREKRRSGEV